MAEEEDELDFEDENSTPHLHPEMMEYLWSDLHGFYTQMNPIDLALPTTTTTTMITTPPRHTSSTPTSASQLWMRVFSLLKIESKTVGKGETLVQYGDRSRKLFYVRQGVCRVFCGEKRRDEKRGNVGFGEDLRMELGALSSGHTFNEKNFLASLEALKRNISSGSDTTEETSNIEVVSDVSEEVTVYSILPEDALPFFHHFPSLEPLLLSLIALQLTTKVRLLTDKLCDQKKKEEL
eukprot:CAMPEP_0201508702 /NCGR_PEP_ID=MMETSP0161_2-20130828/1981_1 /ASSEMBLY_ACC=CAM_ASM_000251 /TAXON_ID=180227 /ORGANISM="Neoparamoeba aestuarina, Strain SoJaBio B1-5/56/2" /LENGTH=236 /DNA_ID=CAMNT_0047903441 /DNA_START=618 /DNA_END=1328 /DNA_ORIENTATION=-